MSASHQLQVMIYNRLLTDAGVAELVEGRVYDGPPETVTFPYLSIGPSDVIEDDAECVDGKIETVQIDCWARKNGRVGPVKPIADAVWAALHKHEGELASATLVEMRCVLSRCFMDPDGLTAHGVVQVSCMIEE